MRGDFRSLLDSVISGEIPRESVKEAVRSLKDQAKRTMTSLELFEELRGSWNQFDPGKTRPYVFFARDYRLGAAASMIEWCDAFFARELVSDLEDAEKGVSDYRSGPCQKRAPVPLGDFREAKREPCPDCGQPALVIGKYWQSCDSPYGDVWELHLLRLCPHCPSVENLGVRSDGYRFGHLLKRPEGE